MSKTSKTSKRVSMAPFDPTAGQSNKVISLVDLAKLCAKRLNTTIPNKRKEEFSKNIQFAWVPASKIRVNYKNQRWPDIKHVYKLVFVIWRDDCVTPLHCRYDAKEDVYYVADGQHHAIAWLLKKGPDVLLPVWYVEDSNPEVESIILLAGNTENLPMAKFFIHEQKVKQNDPEAVEIENAVRQANCQTAFKKRAPGSITHITHLYQASREYGSKALTYVLERYRVVWPMDKISEGLLLGLLKLRAQMKKEGIFTEQMFSDILMECSNYSESGNDLCNNIKKRFEKEYESNYRGINIREKMTSGVVALFREVRGITVIRLPFNISMPLIKTKEK